MSLHPITGLDHLVLLLSEATGWDLSVAQFKYEMGTHDECEGEIDPTYARFHALVDDEFEPGLAAEFLLLVRSKMMKDNPTLPSPS